MSPKSTFTVYGPSSMKFGMKVAHRTLITGKILGSSFLGNHCHGNQKTYSDLAKRPKGRGISSGGSLDGYGCVENSYYQPLLPLKPLSVAMVTQKVPFDFKNSTNWQCWNSTDKAFVYNIVACQRGGVSNEPPGLRAATRHRARDPLVRSQVDEYTLST